MPDITFINHASVLISNQKDAILTDPWYEGDILNNGWKLLYQNKKDFINHTLDNTTYIWISHEHPDHFSVKFFIDYKDKIQSNNIKILFQKTKDRRVVKFLKSKNYDVIELPDNKTFVLNNNFNIHVKRFGFYDSALIVNVDKMKIVNLNDCVFDSDRELSQFAMNEGIADILLTQFSYAAWKGGVNNKNWRIKAANEKLDRILDQAKALNAKVVIPFASFNYFSNNENFYMNETINTPQKVVDKFANENNPFDIVVMQPEEKQNLSEIKQKNDSLKFWESTYSQIKNFPRYSYENVQLDDLEINFTQYQSRIFKNNSKWFMRLLSFIPYLNIFKKLNIHLYDLDKTISLCIFNGVNILSENHHYDVKMHSNSLNFIFNNEFGYDTLTANGNFETGRDGFSKLTKALSIGSLNTLGYAFAPSLIFKPEIYLLFLNLLLRVSKNLENPYD